MLDDLFTYRLDADRWLTVTNAANHVSDLAWFREHAGGFDVQVDDRIDDYAMLAVQGPRARELVQAISDDRSRGTRLRRESRFGQLPPRMTAATRRLAGARCSCAAPATPARTASSCCSHPRTPPRCGMSLTRRGAVPAGLAARDTLRLEACYHLYGAICRPNAGRSKPGWAGVAQEDTGFVGSDAVRAVREAGPAEKLIAFTIDGPGIARPGQSDRWRWRS